jgi:hypothetical protein
VKPRLVTARDADLFCPVNLSQQISEYLPVEKHYFAMEIDEANQMRFAEWVQDLPPEAFTAFVPLFEVLRSLIDAAGAGEAR